MAGLNKQIYGVDDPREEPRPQEAAKWRFLCPSEWQTKPSPPRKFIVDGWIGAGHVTLLYGDGGTGKTLLMHQLMAATAISRPWCGLAVEPCNSVGLFCEDDEDELHRRQEAINNFYECDYSDLDRMTIVSGVGEDNTLADFDNDGHIVGTPSFQNLIDVAHEVSAGLVVIDTAADTFAGDENNRREVRQYLGKVLGKFAKESGAAVVLTAHPSRQGLQKGGDQDGGSTAWNNSVRARLSLARPDAGQDEEPDQDARVLSTRKANYGRRGDTIKLRWQRGVLVPVDQPTGFAAMAKDGEAEMVFLRLLDRWTAENRPVSHTTRAGNFAPKMFAGCPDRQGLGQADFKKAMERLFASKKITVQSYGRASDVRHRIALPEPGQIEGLDPTDTR